ncbi:MAG: hypothetical protein HY778_14465 [Betaproteobacteria bacterium]|nr:hypothetical protein [Betaproteobacteria bacterium]
MLNVQDIVHTPSREAWTIGNGLGTVVHLSYCGLADGTVGLAAQIDRVGNQIPQVLEAESLGPWLAPRAAQAMVERVRRVIRGAGGPALFDEGGDFVGAVRKYAAGAIRKAPRC